MVVVIRMDLLVSIVDLERRVEGGNFLRLKLYRVPFKEELLGGYRDLRHL